MNEIPLLDQLADLVDAALAADDDDLRELYDAMREAEVTLHDEIERREVPVDEDEDEEEDEEEEDDWLDDDR